MIQTHKVWILLAFVGLAHCFNGNGVSQLFSCQYPGFYSDSDDCSVFYRCVESGSGVYFAHRFNCGPGLVFDERLQVCNWPHSASTSCKGNQHRSPQYSFLPRRPNDRKFDTPIVYSNSYYPPYESDVTLGFESRSRTRYGSQLDNWSQNRNIPQHNGRQYATNSFRSLRPNQRREFNYNQNVRSTAANRQQTFYKPHNVQTQVNSNRKSNRRQLAPLNLSQNVRPRFTATQKPIKKQFAQSANQSYSFAKHQSQAARNPSKSLNHKSGQTSRNEAERASRVEQQKSEKEPKSIKTSKNYQSPANKARESSHSAKRPKQTPETSSNNGAKQTQVSKKSTQKPLKTPDVKNTNVPHQSPANKARNLSNSRRPSVKTSKAKDPAESPLYTGSKNQHNTGDSKKPNNNLDRGSRDKQPSKTKPQSTPKPTIKSDNKRTKTSLQSPAQKGRMGSKTNQNSKDQNRNDVNKQQTQQTKTKDAQIATEDKNEKNAKSKKPSENSKPLVVQEKLEDASNAIRKKYSNEKLPPKKSCQREGFFRNPYNCNKFYRCVKLPGTRSFQIYYFDCPAGLVFDERYETCNWPYDAPPCDSRQGGEDHKVEKGTDGENQHPNNGFPDYFDDKQGQVTEPPQKRTTKKSKTSVDDKISPKKPSGKGKDCDEQVIQQKTDDDEQVIQQKTDDDEDGFEDSEKSTPAKEDTTPISTTLSEQKTISIEDSSLTQTEATTESSSTTEQTTIGTLMTEKSTQKTETQETESSSHTIADMTTEATDKTTLQASETTKETGSSTKETTEASSIRTTATTEEATTESTAEQTSPTMESSTIKQMTSTLETTENTSIQTTETASSETESFTTQFPYSTETTTTSESSTTSSEKTTSTQSSMMNMTTSEYTSTSGTREDSTESESTTSTMTESSVTLEVTSDSSTFTEISSTKATTTESEHSSASTETSTVDAQKGENIPDIVPDELPSTKKDDDKHDVESDEITTPDESEDSGFDEDYPDRRNDTDPRFGEDYPERRNQSVFQSEGGGSLKKANLCAREGFFRDEYNCHRFYRCVRLGNTFQKFRFACPAGLVFDERFDTCNWPYAAPPCVAKEKEKEEDDQFDVEGDLELQGKKDSEAKNNKTSSFKCKEEGFFRDRRDCAVFHRCVYLNKLVAYSFRCPKGLIFDELYSVCNYPEDAFPPCNS
ncbi:mucin-22-like protein [Dinothrombium tinctorium]|uniref:Mucin-22-like protein n=1 Tax=Dinothrombium tinctorium TaxID=1965070 RepID=A0A443R7C3_9ACAR|nr:mucin-22-like protein [Dinothrombium tinctorium]